MVCIKISLGGKGLCRTIYQEKQEYNQEGSITEKKIDGLATKVGIEHHGDMLQPKRKFVLFW